MVWIPEQLEDKRNSNISRQLDNTIKYNKTLTKNLVSAVLYFYFLVYVTTSWADDIGSAEEDEGSEEIEKDTRYAGIFFCNALLLLFFFTFSDCICAHCSTRESPSWHHAGPNKQLMCDECCLYYNKYGEMRPFLKGISKESAKHHVIVY